MLPEADPRLDYLGFRLLPPSRNLSAYVRSYWFLRREALDGVREEFMHPVGGYGIAFNFGDALWLDGQQVHAPAFLDGANTRSRKMTFLGRVDLLGVRFYEGGAYPFLGIPLSELRNEIALLEALGSPELLRLHARMAEAPSLTLRMQWLEAWLIERLLQGREQHGVVPLSLAMLREGAGELRIPQVADRLAISQRQLERLFQAQVGISPQQYARLQRVERARQALRGSQVQTTTQLAFDLGYYDQAHFIREFREVIGITPTEYLWKRRRRGE